jgi:tetratricopeptide (TPR) repeat protein
MNLLFALILAQTAAVPTDAQGWFRHGTALHESGNFTGALEAFAKVQQIGYAMRGPLYLRIARAHARAGQEDEAFQILAQMAASGYVNVDALTSENDFLSIRTDARWSAIVQAVRSNRRPCQKDAAYRQFDYWLGEWDVEIGGQLAARSSIQLILGDCTVFENYEQLDGTYAGKSFSLWNARQSRWEQRYVDTTGASREWFGKLEGERMVFYLRVDANAIQRMTYTREGPDRVRQTIDVSRDGEKSWSTAFDGLYIRRR